jgi:hypothetical protein
MEEMIFVGWQYGAFQTDNGRMQNYCNGFFITGFNGEENPDYHFGGQKAVKKKVLKPEVWSGIAPGSKVYVSFDSSGRVSRMELVKKA